MVAIQRGNCDAGRCATARCSQRSRGEDKEDLDKLVGKSKTRTVLARISEVNVGIYTSIDYTDIQKRKNKEMHIHIYIYTYAHIHMYTYMYTYIHIYVYIHVYT